MNGQNKFLFFSFLLAIFILGLIAVKAPALSEIKGSSKEITMLFVGDIMLSRGVADQITLHQDNTFPFQYVKDFLKKADITFGNLEGPISNQGTELGHLYSFRASPKSIEGLSDAGFDIVSLANNHSYDWGPEALTDTIARLRDNNITPVGAGQNAQEAFQPAIITVKEQRIAFFAATDIPPENAQATSTKAGIAWMKPDIFLQGINKIRSQVDLIIISIHSGSEYQEHSNNGQQKFAKKMIDAGADLVIGHHPHVIQEYEKYKNGNIFYSLGNFIFDQNWSNQTSQGQVVEILFNKNIKELNTYNVMISKSTFQPDISINSKKPVFVDR